MKILLSSSGLLPSYGGGEIYVDRLARELQAIGHNPQIVVFGEWNDRMAHAEIQEQTYDGLTVWSLHLNRGEGNAAEGHLGFGPRIHTALKKILKETTPDIVHINAMKAPLTAACREIGIPHIVTAHHAGIICPSGSLLLSDNTICSAATNHRDCVPCCNMCRWPNWYVGGLLSQIPARLYRLYGDKLNQQANLNYFERGLIYPWLVERSVKAKRWLLRNAQHIIAPSFFIRDILLRNGANPSRIEILPHGVAIGKKFLVDFASTRPVRFGYVGRINDHKGLHLAIKALSGMQQNSCELHIFGNVQNETEKSYLSECLQRYTGKANIVQHGYIPPGKIIEAYRLIDVLVVPSIVPEAFGLVVAEAFAAGRPVIVSNSGALHELIRDEINGFIVERNDAKALAKAMQRFTVDHQLVVKMSQNVPQVKDIGEHVKDVERVYARIVTAGSLKDSSAQTCLYA